MDVKTAGRTVEIFETFAEVREPLSLSDIGRALEAPMSSCLYLVRALENRGYLYAVGTRKHIYPTRKLLNLGKAIATGESWIDRLEPHLAELRDATRETVILGKRQSNKVVYLAVLEGPHAIRYSACVGDLKPLHSTSIGKALLSSLDVPERKKIVAKLPLEAMTKATLVDRAALLKDLDKAAFRGYSETRGENVADVMAIARTVQLGADQYGIAIAGPLNRMAPAAKVHTEKLIKMCREIETHQ
jgi:IclR family acetate operon transcriptional repressor